MCTLCVCFFRAPPFSPEGRGRFYEGEGIPITQQECIDLLRNEYALLKAARYPARGDFTPEQVTMIKAKLGPWPRALEKAGIKPAKTPGGDNK